MTIPNLLAITDLIILDIAKIVFHSPVADVLVAVVLVVVVVVVVVVEW